MCIYYLCNTVTDINIERGKLLNHGHLWNVTVPVPVYVTLLHLGIKKTGVNPPVSAQVRDKECPSN